MFKKYAYVIQRKLLEQNKKRCKKSSQTIIIFIALFYFVLKLRFHPIINQKRIEVTIIEQYTKNDRTTF